MKKKWIILLLVAGVFSGCAAHNGHWADEPQARQLHGLDANVVAETAVATLVAASPGIAAEQSVREKPVKRLLTTVHGRLIDTNGLPLPNAPITVRSAARYTTPEKMRTITLLTNADGSFVLPMAAANVLCVDFAAEGKQTLRRWYVALTPNGLKGLPRDRGDISFVSPERKVCDLVSTILVDRE